MQQAAKQVLPHVQQAAPLQQALVQQQEQHAHQQWVPGQEQVQVVSARSPMGHVVWLLAAAAAVLLDQALPEHGVVCV